MLNFTTNHVVHLLIICLAITKRIHSYNTFNELYNDYYNQYYYDEIEDEADETTDSQHQSSSTDYTLYFNDYTFDWSKEEDWDKINIINHRDDDEPYQDIEACTFHISSIQKRVCVHSKKGGGFLITFKSSHDASSAFNTKETAAKSLNSDNIYGDNDIGTFYDDIELDWDNDADWSQITHSLSDYDANTINKKYINDMIQLKYVKHLLQQYQDALKNYKQVYFENYGVYPSYNPASNTDGTEAAHADILHNYYNYYNELPMGEPFTQEMADTLTGQGSDDMYNLYGGATSNAMNGMQGMMHPGQGMGMGMGRGGNMAGMGMNNPFNPQGFQGQQMVNSMAQGMDASGQRQSIRQEARNAVSAIRKTMGQAQTRLNNALSQIHNYISQVGQGYSKMQGAIGGDMNKLVNEGQQIMNVNKNALLQNEAQMKQFAGGLQGQFNNGANQQMMQLLAQQQQQRALGQGHPQSGTNPMLEALLMKDLERKGQTQQKQTQPGLYPGMYPGMYPGTQKQPSSGKNTMGMMQMMQQQNMANFNNMQQQQMMRRNNAQLKNFEQNEDKKLDSLINSLKNRPNAVTEKGMNMDEMVKLVHELRSKGQHGQADALLSIMKNKKDGEKGGSYQQQYKDYLKKYHKYYEDWYKHYGAGGRRPGTPPGARPGYGGIGTRPMMPGMGMNPMMGAMGGMGMGMNPMMGGMMGGMMPGMMGGMMPGMGGMMPGMGGMMPGMGGMMPGMGGMMPGMGGMMPGMGGMMPGMMGGMPGMMPGMGMGMPGMNPMMMGGMGMNPMMGGMGGMGMNPMTMGGMGGMGMNPMMGGMNPMMTGGMGGMMPGMMGGMGGMGGSMMNHGSATTMAHQLASQSPPGTITHVHVHHANPVQAGAHQEEDNILETENGGTVHVHHHYPDHQPPAVMPYRDYDMGWNSQSNPKNHIHLRIGEKGMAMSNPYGKPGGPGAGDPNNPLIKMLNNPLLRVLSNPMMTQLAKQMQTMNPLGMTPNLGHDFGQNYMYSPYGGFPPYTNAMMYPSHYGYHGNSGKLSAPGAKQGLSPGMATHLLTGNPPFPGGNPHILTQKCQPMQAIEICSKYDHNQHHLQLTVRVGSHRKLRHQALYQNPLSMMTNMMSALGPASHQGGMGMGGMGMMGMMPGMMGMNPGMMGMGMGGMGMGGYGMMNPMMTSMGAYPTPYGHQQQGSLYRETTAFDKQHPQQNNYLTNAEDIRSELQNLTKNYLQYHPSNKDNEPPKPKAWLLPEDETPHKEDLEANLKLKDEYQKLHPQQHIQQRDPSIPGVFPQYPYPQQNGGNNYHFHIYGNGKNDKTGKNSEAEEMAQLKDLGKEKEEELKAQEQTAEQVKKAYQALLDRYYYDDEEDEEDQDEYYYENQDDFNGRRLMDKYFDALYEDDDDVYDDLYYDLYDDLYEDLYKDYQEYIAQIYGDDDKEVGYHWDNDYQTGLIEMSDFGDSLGYNLWKAEAMDWKNFDDISAEASAVESIDEYGAWDTFGAYQHYVNNIDFDWDNDALWDINDVEKNIKCSAILPGLFTRICLHFDAQNKDAKIHFDTASVDEINNMLNGDDYDAFDDGQTAINTEKYSAQDIDAIHNMLKQQYDTVLDWNKDDDWNEIRTVYNDAQTYYDEYNKGRRRMRGLNPGVKPFHKGHTYGITLDIGQRNKKSLEVGIPLPVVDKCRNMFLASICLNGNLNTLKFGLKVIISTGKSLLRRAMRLSKLLSKHNSKFGTVIHNFFSELQKTSDTGEKESKTQKDAYHFAKNVAFDNLYDYNDYEEDDGLFDYDDTEEDFMDELNMDNVNQMEYDAMSAEFYAEFGLMSFDEFNTDALWDTVDVLETNDNMYSKVTKKCRKTLGLLWCWCKSSKIGIPFACFGNEKNDKDTLTMQVSQAKQLIQTADNIIDDDFNYNYYDAALIQNYYDEMNGNNYYQDELLDGKSYYQHLYDNVYDRVHQQQMKAAAIKEQRRRTLENNNRKYDDNANYYDENNWQRNVDNAERKAYGYYEDLNLDDIFNQEDDDEGIQDEWIDDTDGLSWSVSNEAIADYDTKWDNEEMWDEITPSVTTIHGNIITRKCLHLWGKRLCLCQFLNWLDSAKYKCLPTEYTIAQNIPIQAYNEEDVDDHIGDGGPPYYNDVGVWHHKLSHKPAVKKVESHLEMTEKHHKVAPGHHVSQIQIKTSHNVHRAPKMVRDEDDEAREVLNGDDYEYYDNYNDNYEETAFMVYKKFIDGVNHVFYSNDNNWDEIRFTNNDDIQKCKQHKQVQVCFCEDDEDKKPFECNEDGEQYSASNLPFMNALKGGNAISEQQLSGMGNIGGDGSALNGKTSMETLGNVDPLELQDMDDYSFTEKQSDQADPMTVNVHFHYPPNYKDRIENGAFGAKRIADDDNMLDVDGVYNDFEYANDVHYDFEYNENDVDDDADYNYDYYSHHFGKESFDDEEEVVQNEHQFEYQQDNYDDDDDDDDGRDIDGSAAFINIDYDQSVIDQDMRISIEKGKNEYVPYINPDVSGFSQRVRISWNTFWKLQLFAIICGATLFVSISIYFNNPFKNLEFPSLYLTQQTYNNVKVFENNDDNIVDDYDRNDIDENQQLKQ